MTKEPTKVTLIKGEFSSLPNSLDTVVDPNLPTHIMILRTAKHEITIDCKDGTMRRQRRPQFEPLPAYGDLMTWAEFCEGVHSGMLDDYDGSGDLATATERSDLSIRPSDIKFAKVADDATPPTPSQRFPWATHVVWFNR